MTQAVGSLPSTLGHPECMPSSWLWPAPALAMVGIWGNGACFLCISRMNKKIGSVVLNVKDKDGSPTSVSFLLYNQ